MCAWCARSLLRHFSLVFPGYFVDSGAENPLREVYRSENVESIRGVVKAWISFGRFVDGFGTISAYMVSVVGTNPLRVSVYLYFLLPQIDQFDQVESLVLIWLRVLLICGLENGMIAWANVAVSRLLLRRETPTQLTLFSSVSAWNCCLVYRNENYRVPELRWGRW